MNKITSEEVSELQFLELIDAARDVAALPDGIEKTELRNAIQARAVDVEAVDSICRIFSTVEEKMRTSGEFSLQKDKKGKPLNTMDNFLLIFKNDDRYADIRFNQMTSAAEIHKVIDGKLSIRKWSDVDNAASMHYCEKCYGIYSTTKHADALRILFNSREYNPIIDIINSLVWDGKERIHSFLTEWAKADDTPYVREVSRLIFAGGINRLYDPGCKFDDVPVLVGTAQGEGKSTLIRWLAINDKYYTDAISEMDGPRSIEQLEGAWICEIAELLALTKQKEQESAKAYITRQFDKYRKPYDREVESRPRRCIFIGSTNHDSFLKDATGNRRYYPITVHSSGYYLHDHEQECRDYIVQCWAEAKHLYDEGKLPNFADQSLSAVYKEEQENAMEDDYRIGLIKSYLDRQSTNDVVCIIQLAFEALTPEDCNPQKPNRKEAQEIGEIMARMPGWEKCGSRKTTRYGSQKCWKKTDEYIPDHNEELPF